MLAQESKILRLEASGRRGDIFVSVEMSRSKWVIGLHTPLAEKIALHTVACSDVAKGQQVDAAKPERAAAMIAVLNRAKGIGPNDASVLVSEAFWRDFPQPARTRWLERAGAIALVEWVGVARSGDTKAGPPMLRAQMLRA